MLRKLKNIAKKVRNKYEFIFCHNKFVKGKQNSIHFGNNTRFKHCNVIVHGANNKVIFGNNCYMTGLRILIEGENNTIEFGEGVLVNASSGQPTVINALGGTEIKIGAGSLFSNNIEIHSSDYHGIYNEKGERVNPDKSITIGSKVWIGLGCTILKGSKISDGSIVGAGSVVSGTFPEENVVIAGNPAKVIKRHVFWEGEKKDFYQVPEELQRKWGNDN